ncbi:MAG: hypothetical protein WBL44_06415 [Nitrososphaeraceae archaeon]|jgi:hypothetical protein
MTSYSPDAAENKPPILNSTEIDELLSMTLIANLATIEDDGGIHLLLCGSCESVIISTFRPLIIHTNTGTYLQGPVHP